jgi:hypothetical protein
MTRTFVWLCLVSGLLAACSSAATPVPAEFQPPEPGQGPADQPTGTPTGPATPVPVSPTSAVPTVVPSVRPPAGAAREFSTDFSRHAVPYDEILSGGPPKDGIPAIDTPQYVSIAEADAWLRPNEPIVLVQVGDDARAFPIQILMWHEIANADVGGLPLAVTFCPLCNTAIAFERRLDGQVLDFGTTGRLRFSNLIMYDRQTETWWQQASGEAIAGEHTGRQLSFHPASIIAWEDFKTAHPQGLVLSRETGINRPYGANPYIGYDDVNRPPFLYQGPRTPGRLPPMARVITVDLNGEASAYPYDVLEQVGVVNDRVGGTELVVYWAPGTASALDTDIIATGRDVGSAVVFERKLNGQLLSFESQEDGFVDEQTGSTWNISGQATDGPLAGQRLTPVVAINHFWFSWAAFRPETRVYEP